MTITKLSSHFFDIRKNLVPPGLEPGTFRVLSERDNHYTMELCFYSEVENEQRRQDDRLCRLLKMAFDNTFLACYGAINSSVV